MRADIRATETYREIVEFCHGVRQPGTGRISDGSQLHISPDGDRLVFSATVVDKIEEEPPTYIALCELATGKTRLITSGPNTDRLPSFSGDGCRIAFLSDRERIGEFQLYILDCASGIARAAPKVYGSVEGLQWSADGERILLSVVGSKLPEDSVERARLVNLPPWMPRVEPSDEADNWRSCWIYDVVGNTVSRTPVTVRNIWAAAWCGDDALAALTSDRGDEDHWYSARLCILDLKAGRSRDIYIPQNQLGAPVVSPSGQQIAIVEALCSDRGPVLGDLKLIDVRSGKSRRANTRNIDVQNVEWQSDGVLLLSGTRGFETVVGIFDLATDSFREVWSSKDVSVIGSCVSGLKERGDCALMVESFTQAPEIAVIRRGVYRQISSLNAGYTAAITSIATAERVSWCGADSLEIQGWLLRPRDRPSSPVVMNVHGGPVQHWRPAFLPRRALHIPILLKHGYAAFLPNPRGSSGRGQAFAQKVLGDLGGADAADLHAGLDALVERGIIDPERIGVTGVSYGGFMTAWLITQSSRFAAAVAISPHTNQVTERLLSNVPQFMSRLVADTMNNPHGRYFERSPVFRIDGTLAPTLNICGLLDRATPAEEAVQFHHALLASGTKSILVTYPHEGHGIRKLPAMLDCAARSVAWFLSHMPAR